ncbi:MAG: glutamate mutase L [Proteobacteria bacterium]|nr:glutamate mutase L [Pseudomonadota bacterium]
MAALAVLVDFGSTYTKAVAVDLERPALVARAQHPSTVERDITIGLEQVLADLQRQAGGDVRLCLASSSARGGLRMVAVGLVPELTAEAARQAALGAGAKVVGVFSHELTRGDVEQIEALRPDLLLLAGGTDGGNREVIVRNARTLAAGRIEAPVIVAGNRVARDEVLALLQQGGKTAHATANVLPALDRLDVEPARAVIREVFVQRIVDAKGLDRALARVDGIVMPTPAAVMQAAQLLSQGAAGEPGWGDVMVVDVGGATTDVHTVADAPPGEGLVPRGLPEPHAKRTVEGDLGLRVSAQSVIALAQARELRGDLARALAEPGARERGDFLAAHTEVLAASDAERRLDAAMAAACVDIAVERHVGHVQEAWGLHGPVRLLHGKDLRGVKALVGVGGVFAHGADPWPALQAALARAELPHSLRPAAPRLLQDAHYVFYAMGLLASREPAIALRLLAQSLVEKE